MAKKKENSNEKQKAPINGNSIASLIGWPAPPVMFPAQPTADEDWACFTKDLALVLADLDDDEFLIISSKRSGLFVQFAGQGSFGLRVETISNSYRKDKPLSQEACLIMQDMGWNLPTNLPDEADPEGHTADGSPNFFVDVGRPVPYDAVSFLAVTTLRRLFSVGHPGELEYKSFGLRIDSIRFPTLRITRERPLAR